MRDFVHVTRWWMGLYKDNRALNIGERSQEFINFRFKYGRKRHVDLPHRYSYNVTPVLIYRCVARVSLVGIRRCYSRGRLPKWLVKFYREFRARVPLLIIFVCFSPTLSLSLSLPSSFLLEDINAKMRNETLTLPAKVRSRLVTTAKSRVGFLSQLARNNNGLP